MSKWYRKYKEIYKSVNVKSDIMEKRLRDFIEGIHGKEPLEYDELVKYIEELKEKVGLGMLETTELTVSESSNMRIKITLCNAEKDTRYEFSSWSGTSTREGIKVPIYYMKRSDLKVVVEQVEYLENKMRKYLDNEVLDLLLSVSFKRQDDSEIDTEYGKYEVSKVNASNYSSSLIGYFRDIKEMDQLVRSMSNLKKLLETDKPLMEFLENSEMEYHMEEVVYKWNEYKIY